MTLLFGRRLASDEEEREQIGSIAGIPVLGLDALASAAYGPEAALTVLLPLGAFGLRYVLPISTLVIVLLTIVYLSYRQTIGAYPSGGGSYTVAKENLGTRAGLVAAAALLLDYVLNVAVAIRRWDLAAQMGLRFALRLSEDIYAFQVLLGDPRSEDLTGEWPDLVETPAKENGVKPPRLVVVHSRYRRLFKPLLRFVTTVARAHPDRQVAVVVPEVVESRWYHYLLHNHTASILKALLLFRGGKGVVVISTPLYLRNAPRTA